MSAGDDAYARSGGGGSSALGGGGSSAPGGGGSSAPGGGGSSPGGGSNPTGTRTPSGGIGSPGGSCSSGAGAAGASSRYMCLANCFWYAPPPPTLTPPPSPDETGVPSGRVAAVWPRFHPTFRAPGLVPYWKPRAVRAPSILPVLNRSP